MADLVLAVNLAGIGSARKSMNDAAATSERRINGLAVSHGIGIGRLVFFLDDPSHLTSIAATSPEVEAERISSAAASCRAQLNSLIAANQSGEQPAIKDILDLQLLILDQSSLIGKIEAQIVENGVNAESALKIVAEELVGRQSTVADPHLREKHLDIADVCNRLEAALQGLVPTLENKYSGAIVAARELRPSVMIELKKCGPAGIITERGGWTSHTSILARELIIPMVSGVQAVSGSFAEGCDAIVDGENGLVIFAPSKSTVNEYASMGVSTSAGGSEFDVVSTSGTMDGQRIAVRANVDIPEAYPLARRSGAEGIGLFRSESLISQPGQIPSEAQQLTAYRQMAEVAGEDGVRIRTFDIGIDQLSGNVSRTEVNPSLGLRSIRLSLHEQVHFRAQIRAILQASLNTKIDILLPMVSGVSEVVAAQNLIDEERGRLIDHGIPFGTPRVGAMIEVPSGVMTSREIARKVDFIALGTNDLVQYLLAIDRDNESVAEWYQTLHPAVLRSIREVINAGEEAGKQVLVCGEMAGSPFYVPVLIGLGARELSMNVNSIKQIRHLISGITVDRATELAAKIAHCETSEETEGILRSFYTQHWADLFPQGLLDAKHR